MKQLVMIVAAVALGATAFAQNAGPKGGVQFKGGNQGAQRPGGRMGGGMKKILDQLNLTAAQKAQVEKLNKAQADKIRAMRDKAVANGKQPDREAFRAQAMKMRDSYMADLKKVLTAAQFKKFEDLMKAQRSQFEKRAGGAGAPGGPSGAKKPGGAKGGGR